MLACQGWEMISSTRSRNSAQARCSSAPLRASWSAIRPSDGYELAIADSFIPGMTPKITGTFAGMRRFVVAAFCVLAPGNVQAIEQTESALRTT